MVAVGSLPPASSLAPVGYGRVPLPPASRLAQSWHRVALCIGTGHLGEVERGRDPRAVLRAWGVPSRPEGDLPQSKGRKPCAGVSQVRERRRGATAPLGAECRPRPPVGGILGLAPWERAHRGWTSGAGQRPLRRRPPQWGEAVAWPPPTATSAQPIATPHLEPRTNNDLQKKRDFFSVFPSRSPPEAPGAPRGASRRAVSGRGACSALIAQ